MVDLKGIRFASKGLESGGKTALGATGSSCLSDDLARVERELERDPERWEAWGAKADLLRRMGRYDESLKCCERSLAFNPMDLLSLTTRGDLLCRLDRCDEARECYRRAMEIDPVFVISLHACTMGISGFRPASTKP